MLLTGRVYLSSKVRLLAACTTRSQLATHRVYHHGTVRAAELSRMNMGIDDILWCLASIIEQAAQGLLDSASVQGPLRLWLVIV